MTSNPQPFPSNADPLTDPDWWRQAAVYQVYPRSFSDSNGDGLGDLQGVTAKVPYLSALGVDAVWLSPFYPSALADGGYDVDDYRDVDPRLGTLAHFDDMAAALHGAGIKLIVDIVPNHSSNRHAWFREALDSPRGSAARERYIFRDGTGPDGAQPPSDWQSVFGGSAWEQVPDGQWYLHLFAPEQPDFNWENRAVKDEFLATLRFWSDRGVDGFRIDVAHALAKDLSEPLPSSALLAAEGDGTDGAHPFWDRNEVHDIYTEWRALFNEYTPPRTAVAEAWVHASRRGRYASPAGLGQAFNFDLLQADFDAARFRTVITDNLVQAAETGASSTWVLSNHDVVRHATRYGLPATPADSAKGQDGKAWVLAGGPEEQLDRAAGLRRARAATLLMLALPGSAYLYQGEELGLHEVAAIPDADRQDPAFFRNAGVEKGRDGCRVPLPWTPEEPCFGFGTGAPHLPQPEWFGPAAVSLQDADTDSTLNFYRRALELRGKRQGAEELAWVPSAASVLHFTRPGGWQSITNFGTAAVALPAGTVLHTSAPLEGGLLPPDTTAWLG
ncbi:glycoside hydrolase family 13 protein [Arthrobacter sp. zg-Y20]|uniref:glycoside hydrolase family 13 protein n=1 Tax=unclassified Arthrobacter TaxID=235627 RepID=UPI001D148BEC|nr:MULTISPECIES: glycoside hydrolase family 13 protein [unclassified Arthrobacter]MCC3274797.1 glycoside hydrolase family 13 protein [Arthrobacter sp. zg-Y20]MDK1314953.1 glycoside hydrolase family 13 protein [Arthrobacter sp. zg.Y20]WIB04807.1 glycoside hydrolase family 13 protein [Arthrobacter sp. zg-Y20]